MDELNEYLRSKYPVNYWTGEKDCNLLIWGANREPSMCTINIGIEYNPYDEEANKKEIIDILTHKYKTDYAFTRLIRYGKYISDKSAVPFGLIIYPSLRQKYQDRWEESEKEYDREKVRFYWSDLANSTVFDLSGKQLKDLLYNKMGAIYTDAGTTKDENSHLADYFHFWSRETLSKNITKLDIDAMILSDNSENGILIEIKRSSKPPIPKWVPHKNDKANYILELEYAKKINALFWLLHHESRPCNNNDIISFYDIKGINSDKTSDYLMTSETVLECVVSGDNSLCSRIEEYLRENRNNK